MAREPEHPHGAEPRRDLHGRGGARKFPAGQEAHAVARRGPHRRQGLRRLRQDAGAVPPGPRQETLTRDANIALLDTISTPVILLTHSQGGAFGWLVADARPNLVKAIVTLEPAAPPIRGVDNAKVAYQQGGGSELGRRQQPDHVRAGDRDAKELQTCSRRRRRRADKVPCYVQQEPARKLKNLQNIPVLLMVGEGSYHRMYDHCLAKWLNQAGVKTEYVEMESVGLRGNGHMMMLENNSADIAKYIGSWLAATRGRAAARTTRARCRRRPSRPFRWTTSRARGSSTRAASTPRGGRSVMRGAMYTEVLVPRQIRHPNPSCCSTPTARPA